MLESIGDFFTQLVPQTGNSFLDAMLVTWLLGVVSYLCRGVPKAIKSICIRYLTTSMMLSSAQVSFHEFMRWLDKQGYSDKFRQIQIRNGRWGSEESTKGAGNGSHLFWFHGRPVVLTLEKVESFAEYEKERLSIRIPGRGHGLLDSMLRESHRAAQDGDGIKVFQYNDCWVTYGEKPKRDLDSVVLPDILKISLLDRLDRFTSSEHWYIEKGIPWHLGIMLYGPPGTGKSSLIQAVASYLNKGISALPAHRIAFLEQALASASADTIVAIEDIDTSHIVHARKEAIAALHVAQPDIIHAGTKSMTGPMANQPTKPSDPRPSSEELAQFWTGGGLSMVLNSLDGLNSVHGRILVMTANSIQDLDPALLRPGRIDMCLEIGYMDALCFEQMLRRFFPGACLPARYRVEPQLMPARVQEEILRGWSFEEIVEAHELPAENPVQVLML